jgi:hypothetical protein
VRITLELFFEGHAPASPVLSINEPKVGLQTCASSRRRSHSNNSCSVSVCRLGCPGVSAVAPLLASQLVGACVSTFASMSAR